MLLVLACACVAEAFGFASLGRSIIDEGVFLTAGRLVYEGQLPYRDFPFSQAPVVAYLYGIVVHLFGSSVLAGRLLSFVLGLLGLGAAVWIARALAGRLAAGIVLLLSMLNLPALWVAGTVRTQSVSTPLTMLSVLALAMPRRGALGWALSPSLMLWATGARLTNALALLAILGWVALQLRAQPKRLAAVAALVSAQALVIFAPVLAAPRAAAFHLLTAQLGRGERAGPTQTSFGREVAEKFSIFAEPETSFFVICSLGLVIAVALAMRLRRGWRPDFARPLAEPGTAQLTLLGLALLVFLPHLLLNRGFLTYFVTSSALLIPAIAIGVAALARETSRIRVPALGAVIALLIAGAAMVPSHLGAWVGSGPSSFRHFREVAREVRTLAGPGCTIVTMETALAVEAGCRVLPGLEYSLFSYFPHLGDDEAEARGVLNAARLAARVREHRPELIVLGPRGRSSLRLGPATRRPPSPGFLARDGYTFVERYRISSGAFIRAAPDSVEVDVFARDDLLQPGRARTATGAVR